MTRRFVFDTVVLANFALADALGILSRRYAGRAIVPAEVWDELAAGVSRGFAALRRVDELIADDRFRLASLNPQQRIRYRELRRSLGSGEASCIAWSQGGRGVVVSDDRRARQACRSAGVPFTGTIGILVATCRDGTLDAEYAESVLRRMRRAGYYSPVSRLGDLL